jgi:hypothetical protein
VTWTLIAVAAVTVPLVVGLALAAVLSRVGSEVGGLLEAELWTSAPPTSRSR